MGRREFHAIAAGSGHNGVVNRRRSTSARGLWVDGDRVQGTCFHRVKNVVEPLQLTAIGFVLLQENGVCFEVRHPPLQRSFVAAGRSRRDVDGRQRLALLL